MASWVLIPALKTLFAEFDRIAPKRDKASDGSIGDTAHSQTKSDHNPDSRGLVHAIDVDNNLNESDLTMEKVVQFLLARCRSGAEKRLRYIIYNRRIWSASSDWVQKTYTGASPHTEHAHFSASYTTSLEASTASWHLEDIPVAMTAADKTWVQNQNKDLLTKIEDLLESGAVARGLRSQPNNLSDTERAQLAEVISPELAKVLREMLGEVAAQIVSEYRVPGTNVEGETYLRSLADLTGDVWFATMLGTTKGRDPLPGNGFPGQTLTLLAEINNKLDALASGEDNA